MSQKDARLETAVKAAQDAGEVIARRYPRSRDITSKGFRDLVTDADLAAQEIIVEQIQNRFPGHHILSEEAGTGNPNSDYTHNEYTWVVDPLDGTTNYAHHHPVFAVSVGLLRHGDPIVGVVHNPLSGETFVARKGAGATVNDRPIHVSPTARLKDAMVAADWGHANEARTQTLAYIESVLLCCGTVRAMGSAALALAYVAAGWLDAYFQTGLKPWDVAAGMILIREAGDLCTTLTGEPYSMNRPDCLTTNGRIHSELLTIITKNNQKKGGYPPCH